MSERDYRLFLTDIRDCAHKILEYVQGKSYDEFLNTPMLIDAVIRNLEIIGEATKHLPEEIKEKFPGMEWKDMAGFRDLAIHQYFVMDYEIIWDIVQNKLTALEDAVQAALGE